MRVLPGPPAILHLHVTGTPTPAVQWYHNDSRSGEVVAVRETGPGSRSEWDWEALNYNII